MCTRCAHYRTKIHYNRCANEQNVKFKEGIMVISQALKSLVIDHWYKLLAWLGGVVTLGAVFVDVEILTNHNILLFFGVLLIGLGEWASHREEPFERETAHGTMFLGREMRRFRSIRGNTLSVLGLLVIIFGSVFGFIS
ncbi:MAG: hypothetical protein V7784_23215 [Oceanospirillaceae bacterium]